MWTVKDYENVKQKMLPTER